MILFFGMLQGYEVSKKLLDVSIRITPVGNKSAYLALGSDGLQLASSPDEIARISKKGTKKYRLLLKGTPVCHKSDKRADSCEKGKNKTKNWNIKKGPNGYSIKSAKEKYMGFRQYCLTYDKGPSGKVEIKKCRRDRRNQLFDMEPVEPEKETSKPDEKKDDEKKNDEIEREELREKECDCSKNEADSDEESLTRDSLSSSEEVEIFDPKVGPKKDTPQQPQQPQRPQQPEQPPAYSPYYPAAPQMPVYAYVPYVPPQPEQPCVCAEAPSCVCLPDSTGAQQAAWK